MENYLLFFGGPILAFVIAVIVLGTWNIVIPNWRQGKTFHELGWRKYFRF